MATCAEVGREDPQIARASFELDRATIERVQSSWQQLMQRHFPLAHHFYLTLFAKYPELEPMFPQNWNARQHHLTDVLNTVVLRMSLFEEELVPIVKSLGRRHATYGVTKSMFDQVGECLIETLCQGLGEQADGETLDSWRQMYTALAAVASGECPPSIQHSALCTLWCSDVFRITISSNSIYTFCEDVHTPEFERQTIEQACLAKELKALGQSALKTSPLAENGGNGSSRTSCEAEDVSDAIRLILEGMHVIAEKSFNKTELFAHFYGILCGLSGKGFTASDVHDLLSRLQRTTRKIISADNEEQGTASHLEAELETRFWDHVFRCMLDLVDEMKVDWNRLNNVEMPRVCYHDKPRSLKSGMSSANGSTTSLDRDGSTNMPRARSLKSNIVRLHGYSISRLEPIPDDTEAEILTSDDDE